jgi:hypothetical protein
MEGGGARVEGLGIGTGGGSICKIYIIYLI